MVVSVISLNHDRRLGGHCSAWNQNQSMGPVDYSLLDRYFYNIYNNFGDSRWPSSIGWSFAGGGNYYRVKFIVSETTPDESINKHSHAVLCF